MLAIPAFYLWALDAVAPVWIAGVVLNQIPASILSITFVQWMVTLAIAPRNSRSSISTRAYLRIAGLSSWFR